MRLCSHFVQTSPTGVTRQLQLSRCPYTASAHMQADELRQQLAASAAGLKDMNGRLAASQREVAELTALRNAQLAAKTSRWGRSR